MISNAILYSRSLIFSFFFLFFFFSLVFFFPFGVPLYKYRIFNKGSFSSEFSLFFFLYDYLLYFYFFSSFLITFPGFQRDSICKAFDIFLSPFFFYFVLVCGVQDLYLVKGIVFFFSFSLTSFFSFIIFFSLFDYF